MGTGLGRKEEWSKFYSSDDYVKDETTNQMTAEVSEETCNANDGFVCKVREGVQHDDDDDEKEVYSGWQLDHMINE